MANMVVSGAEITGINGVYEEVDARTHQWLQYIDWIGNIAYWKSSSSFGYGDCITSYGGLWYIGYFAGVDDGTSDIYKSSDRASSPNLVGSWFYYGGNPSNATVTAAGGGAQNLTLSCAAGSYSLAGVACTLTYTPAAQNLTLSCGAGSLALTGTACTLSVKRNFALSCSAGSYAVTGTSASLTKNLVMACESGGVAYPGMVVSGAGTTEYNGTYAVYGTQGGKPLYRKNTPEVVGGYAYIVYNATYKYWFISPIDSDTGNLQAGAAIYYSTNDVDTPDLVTTWQKLHGSLPVPTVVAITYSLTGSDVTLTYTPATDDYTLVCESGSYTLTGTDISFVITRVYTLACESGSYALTGTNADLLAQYHYSLACNSGSYLLTGTPTSLTSARSLACNSGAYVLTGLEADLFKGLVMPCGNGSYILTGSPATINSARTFVLGMGSYVLVGTDVGGGDPPSPIINHIMHYRRLMSR